MIDVNLYLGDCLEVMPSTLVDLVLADPPYMIGAASVGNARTKAGTWADMVNAGVWYASWFELARQRLKATGFLAVFGNWRSLPTYINGLARCNLTATNCLVWDKEWIGPAGPGQFRPTWELILLAAMPEARIADRGVSDVVRHKWMAAHSAETEHPAEKPVQLCAWLIEHLVPIGGAVLDPFMGSGTTGVACARTGRNFIGVEIDPAYFEVAKHRIDEAQGMPSLFQLTVSNLA